MASDRIVIDSGYLVEAVVPTTEAWRAEAVDLIQRLAAGEVEGCVPWIFFAECAVACTKATRWPKPQRLDPDVAQEFLEQIDGLGLDVDLTLDGAGAIFSRAATWQSGAYDSLYVDLALRMGGLPIATRDKGMRTAAKGRKLSLM